MEVRMTVVLWLLVAVVALLTLLVVGLLRSHAEIIRALHDAGINLDPDGAARERGSASDRPRRSGRPSPERPVIELESSTVPDLKTMPGVPGPVSLNGQRAADLVGTTPDGATRSVAVLGRQPTLLAFLTTGCATCATFWNEFAAGPRIPGDMRLIIVTRGAEAESPADVGALAPAGVVTLQSTQAWDDYRIPVAPYFVLVDGARGVVVGEGAAHSWALVLELLERALADAGYRGRQVKRRDMFLGRARARRVDADLLEAGIVPGDPRLHHPRLDTEQ
jgi:hypothetical protein